MSLKIHEINRMMDLKLQEITWDLDTDSLHYDGSPTEQKLWVTEYVMHAFEDNKDDEDLDSGFVLH